MLLKTLAVLIAVAAAAQALTEIPHHARGGLAWRQRAPKYLSTPEKLYIDMPLDHTNPASKTYKNMYYIDRSGFKGKYCFMIMGGEAPLGGIGDNYITYLASKYDAMVVAIEHRFYGESVPNNDYSNENLKFLTSRQALADVALLIDAINNQTTGGCTWFTFGGSYSGALSAWFRLKYPEHTRGSLSSSGVVNAVLQFTAFDVQVATAIGDVCANNLRNVMAAFDRAMTGGQGAAARALFGIRPDLSDGDFAYMLADGSAMVDQYGHKADLCNALAVPPASASDMEVMKNFADFINKYWGADFGSSCFYDTQCVANDPSRWQPTSRSWWWQTCYELAYFQNAPATGSLRLPLINMTYHLTRCGEQFYSGIYPDTVDTNNYYGGAYPNGTNIFFSDFSDDPWQQASVNATLSADLPYAMVTCDGCGHCMDFHKPAETDPPALTQERSQFETYLALWLN